MSLADTLAASFNQVVNDIVTALPAIIGAVVILIVGYIIARVASGVVRNLLARSADRAVAQRSGEVYGARASAFPPSRIGA